MKFIIFFFLLMQSLLAKDAPSCYTLQLLSMKNSPQNSAKLLRRSYPDSCRVMQISNILTVRCGCYDEKSPLEKELATFKTKYKKAYIRRTYKYRFAGMKKEALQKEKPTTADEPYVYDMQELKTYLEDFLRKKEFEYAYEIAKLGYESKPNSFYWNQKILGLTLEMGHEEAAKKYIDYLYKSHYERLFLDLKQTAYSDTKNENYSRLDLEYMPKRKQEVYFQMYWRLASMYKDIDREYASKFFLMPKKNQKYKTQSAKLLAYSYFKSYDVESAYNALTLADTKDADKEYYKLLEDFTWYNHVREEKKP